MNNTPKLRFKEFSGDWKKKKLGKITKLTDGVHFTPTYVESGVPFWSVETVVSNANPKYITQEAHNDAIKRCNPQINDILLTRIGTLAKPKLINWNEEFSIYVSLALIKASNNYNSKFARYYFETEYYQKDFLSKSLLTATPKKINMEDLKQTNINLPSLEEQEKIASFFSLIDDKISLQGEKVEALKDYKKGMMQKIFSRELKFKDDDGRDYPEWGEKKLGDIGIFTSGTGFSEKYQGYLNMPIKVFKVSDMNISGNTKYMINSNNTISYDILKEMKSKSINKPSIIFAKVGAAIFLERKRIVNTEFLIDNNMMAFIPNENNDIEFIHSLMNTIQLSRYAQVGALPSYNASDISSIKVKIPCLDEQNKISKTLCVLDIKIEREQEKLDSLNEYKKGLLQQMFV